MSGEKTVGNRCKYCLFHERRNTRLPQHIDAGGLVWNYVLLASLSVDACVRIFRLTGFQYNRCHTKVRGKMKR